jgi:hypothetical protein
VSNSWDDDIRNIWKVTKAMFQTTNQSFHCNPLWLTARDRFGFLFLLAPLKPPQIEEASFEASFDP